MHVTYMEDRTRWGHVERGWSLFDSPVRSGFPMENWNSGMGRQIVTNAKAFARRHPQSCTPGVCPRRWTAWLEMSDKFPFDVSFPTIPYLQLKIFDSRFSSIQDYIRKNFRDFHSISTFSPSAENCHEKNNNSTYIPILPFRPLDHGRRCLPSIGSISSVGFPVLEFCSSDSEPNRNLHLCILFSSSPREFLPTKERNPRYEPSFIN